MKREDFKEITPEFISSAYKIKLDNGNCSSVWCGNCPFSINNYDPSISCNTKLQRLNLSSEFIAMTEKEEEVDLTKVLNVGDWVGVAGRGWVQITRIIKGTGYSIRTDRECFMKGGIRLPTHKFPTLWINPPEALGFGPKPENKKKLKPYKELIHILVDAGYVCSDKGNWYRGLDHYFLHGLFKYCGKPITMSESFYLPEWLEEDI